MEFAFLMASAVCWVSPNISGNQLEVAQLEGFGSQHQMSGPQWVPLRIWGQRTGQGLGPGPTTPGPWESFVQKTLSAHHVPGREWELGRRGPAHVELSGWLPTKDSVVVEASLCPQKSIPLVVAWQEIWLQINLGARAQAPSFKNTANNPH